MPDPIYLDELQRDGETFHNRAIRIVGNCGAQQNLAAICRAHGHLDLKAEDNTARYLIGEIKAQGVNILISSLFKTASNGATHCWAGVGYEGRIEFGSISKSISFLKKFFDVKACMGNKEITQEFIDGLPVFSDTSCTVLNPSVEPRTESSAPVPTETNDSSLAPDLGVAVTPIIPNRKLKVKVFQHITPSYIESKMNEWIEKENPSEIISITQSQSQIGSACPIVIVVFAQ